MSRVATTESRPFAAQVLISSPTALWSRVLLAGLVALAAACANPPSASPQPEGLEALPDEVDYVALGDSIATGAAATTSYVEEFASRVEGNLDRNVAITNLARNGWTSADLLRALRTDPAVREAVAGADLITWNIGGNDLLRVLETTGAEAPGDEDTEQVGATVDELKARWDEIVAELADLRRDDTVVLRTMDVYHPFVAQHRQAGVFETLAPFLDEVNAHLAATEGEHGIRVAEVHAAINGAEGLTDPAAKDLLAVDGVHPSDTGQRLIAELLFDLG